MLYEKLLPATIEGGTPTDPNFNQVSLLLHGDGTNGAQNNTFIDSSSNAFTVTRTGNVAQGTFSPFSLAAGQWSNYFDGTGDCVDAPANAAFAMGTGDFTLEEFFYLDGLPANNTNYALIDLRGTGTFSNSAPCMSIRNTSGSYYIRIETAGTVVYDAPFTPSVGQWYHVAFVRSSGTGQVYLNGSALGSSFSYSTNFTTGYAVRIGMYNTTTSGFNGYLSNARIVKGTAVYTGSYTVPTAPLTAVSGTSLLTCQSNRFVDNSSNNFTITPSGNAKTTAFSPFAPSAAYDAGTNGGSGYFDGTGDILSIADTSALNLNSVAFSVEYWIYPTASPATITVMGKMSGFTANPTAGWSMWLSSMRPTFGINGVFNSLLAPAANAIPVGSWSHIAATSDGSTYTNLYVNGVRVATSASVNTNATALPFVLGGNINGTTWNNTYNVTGYITNARVIKGTSLSSGTTYPLPTAPLSAVSNTQLLLNCVNAGIYDNAIKNDIETVGNAQISTSVKKYGTGSLAFDGAGDYLTFSPLQNTAFRTGDFTVEFWTNFSNASGSNFYFIDTRNSGQTANWAIFRINTGNTLNWYTGATQFTGPIFTTTNVWTHVAFSRSGTSLRLFIDGVLQNTFTDTTNYSVAPSIAYVGTRYTAAEQLNGYIDDLRITKGIARYTTNFTPPTQAFPNV